MAWNKTSKKLKIVAWIISVLLFTRGIDILLVYITQNVIFHNERLEHDYFVFFNIFKLIFYFLETGPAIVLLFTHYKEYKELKNFVEEHDEFRRLTRDESSIVSGYTYSKIIAHQNSRETETKFNNHMQTQNSGDLYWSKEVIKEEVEDEPPMRFSTNSMSLDIHKYKPK